ncbi:hypothetical protein K373_05694 [Streptomyces sp. DvalAA-21]|nr:conserved hypothetical protein [Streptomyces sp. SirexAA-E]PZX32519.1 hypothetical protein K373_05694 [Streptomyces sp. DvalAA-21]RAJ28772.1 hypothetical protein K351_05634 [Streptomyces sp. DpondAA-E10]RAJ42562.1 hypothetical protein K352_05625 [Streptomyces sp. DpondAA-A50]SCE54309.1 hypothetical protein GA0115235_12442 [Streptomyces sp. DpondAA-F4a]SCM13571.1 hypothetical protein SAMN04883147_109530 [Streptomyces sp. DpondAA-F4]
MQNDARTRVARPRFMDRFGLFSECLLTGVWIALAALPLLTFPAALAAGTRHLRRHLAGERGGFRAFVTDARAAARGGWLVGASVGAAGVLLLTDLAAVRAGLPGGPLVGAVGILALIGLLVAVVRAAARWEPGDTWRALLADAGRCTVRDPAGSLLLVCGMAVVVLSGALVLPLAVPVLGALAAAATAVEARRSARRPAGDRYA